MVEGLGPKKKPFPAGCVSVKPPDESYGFLLPFFKSLFSACRYASDGLGFRVLGAPAEVSNTWRIRGRNLPCLLTPIH